MDIKSLVKPDFITVEDEATVSELIGKMKNYEKHSGLVFRKKKYIGLVEKKKLLTSRIDVAETKIKKYVQQTPILAENADVLETARLMGGSNLDFLPVQRDKQIIGVIEAVDVVAAATRLPEVRGLRARDFKLTKEVGIGRDDPIARAIEIMYNEHVDYIPVFENGKLYGIISYRDILRNYLNWSPKRDFSKKFNKITGTKGAAVDMPHLASLPVSSFSTNDNLVTASLSTTLPELVSLMVKNRVTDVLLMDEEDFVGLVTAKSILRKIASLNPVQNFTVKVVGLHDVKLMPHQQQSLERIAFAEAEKIQREVHAPFDLVLHLKHYGGESKQQKFSVHVKVDFAGKIIACSQDDWKLETALHRVFEHCHSTIKNRFHGDTTKGKFRKE